MLTQDLTAAVAALAVQRRALSIDAAVEILDATAAQGSGLVSRLTHAVGEKDLLAIVADELGSRFVDLNSRDTDLEVDPSLVVGLDLDTLIDRGVLPMRNRAGESFAVVANLADPLATDIVTAKLGPLSKVLAPRTQIVTRLITLQAQDVAAELETDTGQETTLVSRANPNAPVTEVTRSPVEEWVDSVLSSAATKFASDVHFQQLPNGSLWLRFRIDGELLRQPVPPGLRGRERQIIAHVLGRAESSGVKPDGINYPQDGQFAFSAAGRSIDARLSMIPDANGHAGVVLRLLDSAQLRQLSDMGLAEDQVEVLRRAMSARQGAVLTSGPTGSGKSTTMYSLLGTIDPMVTKVVTLEDPVEYRLANITQIQVRADLDPPLSFASGLRAILRHDPDVILLGEIRDEESATVAVEAAITGHLLLSTTHANSAAAIYSRLAQMGVSRYLMADALTLLASQRLVRRLHECSTTGPVDSRTAGLLTSWGVPVPDMVPVAVGCNGCNGTGYQGRILVLELLSPDEEIRHLVTSGATDHDIATAAIRSGQRSLIADAGRHVLEGRTTVDELITRVASGAML